MEKAADVASKVGDAMLKFKKAVPRRPLFFLDFSMKPRIANVPLFGLLITFFISRPNGMPGIGNPFGIEIPKYERTTEISILTATFSWIKGGAYMIETDFSSEYLEGPTPFIDVRAVAVEEKHKTGRNGAWRKNVTYLKRNWNKVTRYVLIRKRKDLVDGLEEQVRGILI